MRDCWLRPKCNGVYCDAPHCERYTKENRLLNAGFISEKARTNCSPKLTNYNKLEDEQAYSELKHIKQTIGEFVKEGKNLYIWSNGVGNGKTMWATNLACAYIEDIWPTAKLECKVLFINVPSFLLALKDSISKESEYIDYVKDNILKCDLVVFDELGAKVATQYELDHLLSYINERIYAGKSNIFTSNIPPGELSTYLGDRLASRVSGMSEKIEFRGRDMRGVKC